MVVAQVMVRFLTRSVWPSISWINSFPSEEFSGVKDLTEPGVKDLTEHSEEVGNRELRPKERVLAKANRADSLRRGGASS